MSKTICAAIMGAVTIAAATPAAAAEIAFNGSMTGFGLVASNAACAPIPFRGTITGGTGSSSDFGAFSYNHTVCTSGQGGGPIVGNYLIDFGIDNFFGQLSGIATPSAAVPGTSTLAISYTILGGTGRFLGATGAFVGSGTADPRVRPSIVQLNFAAVPEPSTWAMMLIGFAAIGGSMRRSRRAIAVFRPA